MSNVNQHEHMDEVPVRTKLWCTITMIPCASFMCLMQVSLHAQQHLQGGPAYGWMLFCTMLAIPSGLILLGRSRYPRATFWVSCVAVLLFPYDPMIALMALTALLARRNDTRLTIRSIVVAGIVALWSQLRDAFQPANASIWHAIYAQPGTNDAYGSSHGSSMVMLVDERTIIITAIIASLVELAIATLIGLHIRSRALAAMAGAKASAAENHAQSLRNDLSNQQLSDAIAAEAHDTLAHSLSLLALNASALHAQSQKLRQTTSRLDVQDAVAADIVSQAAAMERTADDIRKQAAGALDEAHSVIDMLRHPEQARIQLANTDETSLTGKSLNGLLADARAAGARINTWIDVQQLSQLDEMISKIAYRTIQEGLTNARRHAPDEEVSVEVTACPQNGVSIHISNPTDNTPTPRADSRTGAGLAGLLARTKQVGGTCDYGFDERHVFHLVVRLPWVG